jgi:hypothetical protein
LSLVEEPAEVVKVVVEEPVVLERTYRELLLVVALRLNPHCKLLWTLLI